jgi:hypothetical protein
MNDVKVGTFAASASAVNVECGFVPDFVNVIDRATPSVSMGVPGGAVGVNIAAAAAAEAAALTVFEGEAPYTNLTGTIASTVDVATLTGTSTLFTTELYVGETVILEGVAYIVIAISSATSLVIDKAAESTASGVKAARLQGRGKGFTVPAAYTANVSGTNDFVAYR